MQPLRVREPIGLEAANVNLFSPLHFKCPSHAMHNIRCL